MLTSTSGFLTGIQNLIIWGSLAVAVLGIIATIIGARVILKRYLEKVVAAWLEEKIVKKVDDELRPVIVCWEGKFAERYAEYTKLKGKS